MIIEIKQKEPKINIPEGYEIDKKNSTFECIKFKPIEKKLPETWEEFCKTHPWKNKEAWIDDATNIKIIKKSEGLSRNAVKDRNLLPNKKYAEAILALCQLIQLRDCYNDGWVPDWTKYIDKYNIRIINNQMVKSDHGCENCILAFKTKKLRDKFLKNFRGLIETAKPLI